MITDHERDKALGLLARSRQTLLDAVEGVSDNQARWKPAADRWSILEYVEHLAVSDDGLIALIKYCLTTPARPETEEQRRAREAKIRDTPIPRGANHAPDRLCPQERFASLREAVAAFLAARERTFEYARNTKDDLRNHFTDHGVLGPLDGYQWLVGNARHAETHAAHIREIRAMAEYPRT
jgi:hypothetical protein